MAVLVVKCPINGRYFSTGIQIDADSFALMAKRRCLRALPTLPNQAFVAPLRRKAR